MRVQFATTELKAAEAEYQSLRVRLQSDLMNQRPGAATVNSDYTQAKLQSDTDKALYDLGVISGMAYKNSKSKADELTTRRYTACSLGGSRRSYSGRSSSWSCGWKSWNQTAARKRRRPSRPPCPRLQRSPRAAPCPIIYPAKRAGTSRKKQYARNVLVANYFFMEELANHKNLTGLSPVLMLEWVIDSSGRIMYAIPGR